MDPIKLPPSTKIYLTQGHLLKYLGKKNIILLLQKQENTHQSPKTNSSCNTVHNVKCHMSKFLGIRIILNVEGTLWVWGPLPQKILNEIDANSCISCILVYFDRLFNIFLPTYTNKHLI